MESWGRGLVEVLPRALSYVESAGVAVDENKTAWDYFGEKWRWYLEQRGIHKVYPIKVYDLLCLALLCLSYVSRRIHNHLFTLIFHVWRSYSWHGTGELDPNPGPLFTKRTDVLPLDLMKSRSSKIGCYNERIALKFDRHIWSAAGEVPVKFGAIGKV